ncbi:MAG: CNNM domain-containing protein [Bacteroidales bacterium]|nr:CNNM domain-containing protein [Bacteroidales bacterium]
MILLIVYLLIALMLSFLCSIMEAVILSITPSFATMKEQQRKPYAGWLKQYKSKIDRPLAAILTLNTFAHTIGAAGVGAQAQLLWGNKYLSLVSVILTILILIISEIIPKTIGANFWRALTPFTVYTLRVLMVLLYPFVIISQLITKAFNIKNRKNILSRADFSAMAELAVNEGVIRKGESKIIQNIARFDRIKAKDIMTPRTIIFAAPEQMTVSDFYRMNDELRFSRIPVYNKTLDQIKGYFLKDDMLINLVEGNKNVSLKSFARDIIPVYVNTPIQTLYTTLTSNNEHIALVVDEYGGTSGIVTLEDIVETILGLEIVDELDNIEDLQLAARQSWEKRARRMGLRFEK